MEPKAVFILENLEKKSNAILAFIVFQSIYFGEKLSNEEFTKKILEIKGFYNYLFIAHTITLSLAILLLLMIDKRISKGLDKDINKAIQPHATLAIKILIAIIFGSIPIIIFINHMLQ